MRPLNQTFGTATCEGSVGTRAARVRLGGGEEGPTHSGPTGCLVEEQASKFHYCSAVTYACASNPFFYMRVMHGCRGEVGLGRTGAGETPGRPRQAPAGLGRPDL